MMIMNDKRYRELYEQLDLSQVRMATFLGVDPRTSRRWALGEKNMPYDAAILLELMAKHKLTPDEARELADLPPADEEHNGPLALLMLVAVACEHGASNQLLQKYAAETKPPPPPKPPKLKRKRRSKAKSN
jgi:hypothetical protein